jgi:hypothetical protein
LPFLDITPLALSSRALGRWKALLGIAYEFATGRRLASGDFEGGKVGAVRVLGKLGFTVQRIPRPSE